MVSRKVLIAVFSPSPERAMWPPAAWPVSWAMTPISWLGVLVSMIRPVLIAITGPAPVWALISLSPSSTSLTALGSRPAAMKMGSASWCRIASISVSRITWTLASSWAWTTGV